MRGDCRGVTRADRRYRACCEGTFSDLEVCEGDCGGVWAAGAMGVVCAVPRLMKGMYCTVLY